jgi:hypothetical protein
VEPGEKFLGMFVERSLSILSDFTAQALANTINALAKMTYHPGPAFMNLFTDEARKRLRQFKPQVRRRRRVVVMMMMMIITVVVVVVVIMVMIIVMMMMIMVMVMTTTMMMMMMITMAVPQELAITLNGYAKLGIDPGACFLILFTEVAFEKLPGFDGQVRSLSKSQLLYAEPSHLVCVHIDHRT